MNFGKRMRVLRVTRGYSQEKLADLAMTDNRFISYIETGKLLPAPSLEKRLRESLDWTEAVDEMLEAMICEQKSGAASVGSTYAG